MDRILIKGNKKLEGEVEISGAKNSALPIIAATLLTAEECRLSRVPSLKDVKPMLQLLGQMGTEVQLEGDRCAIRTPTLKSCEAPYQLVKTMRASVLVLGPLLARFGEARVSLPGGCAIGARPINLHIAGLQKMGAEVEIAHGYVEARAQRLKGARICLDLSTVTGTENLMMAAVLAEGTTVIENAACEPEVEDLAKFLNQCGAKIEGAGTRTLVIEGVSSLTGTDYDIMPDRIEAGTYILAGAITGGDVRVRRCLPGHMGALLQKLLEMGVSLDPLPDGIRVRGLERTKAVDVETTPYPGFPTDMQAQIMALMAVSRGRSVVAETVFENRFTHVAELRRMGAEIRIRGNAATIQGVASLGGAPVMASDLRASASLILAGLVAEGQTEIHRIYHLDRGYERLCEKLTALGADIRRVS
ncbi:MAG: UDP-N-acetylglucosamine 1-carboxyvinyltransferase [Nitrospirae bacterium]|nr:UDP-N-acetylglucosamine 1-carboxyvinyltransferase [Nitrospirota bacterium]